ncbi:hypothetical protein [Bombiscardovia apis]|nr:hypothetical protein [Bombiscardovia apis]
MPNPIVTRLLSCEGDDYLLFAEQPVEDGHGAWETRVGLLQGDKEILSLTIGGCDSLQSLLLALSVAKSWLVAKGGFTFDGNNDLMLPDI